MDVEEPPLSPTAKLYCSVIVPVFEHWERIPALLQRLQGQTLEQERFEVLLVDNGSKHFSPPEKLPGNVRILRCPKPGSYAARNYGIAHAAGEWLVFTDADCLPRAQWLECLLRERDAAAGEPIVLAGAVEMVGLSPNPTPYEVYDLVKGIPQKRYVARGYAATANLAVPKEIAKRLQGFDETRFSGGDADFCRRAVAAGILLQYVPEAVVEHPPRTSWEELAQKARRVKGGQLTAGPRRRQHLWWARTFMPPVRAVGRFLGVRHVPLRYRLVAIWVQLGIWATEMREAVRLLGSAPAERR